MSKNQLVVRTEIGWARWIACNVLVSATGNAASAATKTFLENIVNPTIWIASTATGYVAGKVVNVALDVTLWGVYGACSGVSKLLFSSSSHPEKQKSTEWENVGDEPLAPKSP